MSNKIIRKHCEKSAGKNEAGFSMVEAVAAIFILTIGLIGTAAAITYALEFGSISRNITSAKSVIVSSIEEIETLRNSRRLNFRQFANVGGVDNTDADNPFGGFSKGFKPVSLIPGLDGVNGTDDDLKVKKSDGTIFEDQGQIRSGYMRQITITDLSNNLKRVEVKVRYLGRAGKTGEITGVSYLNDEARITR